MEIYENIRETIKEKEDFFSSHFLTARSLAVGGWAGILSEYLHFLSLLWSVFMTLLVPVLTFINICSLQPHEARTFQTVVLVPVWAEELTVKPPAEGEELQWFHVSAAVKVVELNEQGGSQQPLLESE